MPRTELTGVIATTQKQTMTGMTISSHTKVNMKYEMINDCPVIITDVRAERADIKPICTHRNAQRFCQMHFFFIELKCK